MSDRPDPRESGVEIREGRTFPRAEVGDWVMVSDVPKMSKLLYAFLRAHVNGARERSRGDSLVWPSQQTLADLMGIKDRNQIRIHTKPLIELGAVEVETYRYHNGMRQGLCYVVHLAPPPGYAGLVSLADWYEARKPPQPDTSDQQKVEKQQVGADAGKILRPDAGKTMRREAGKTRPPGAGKTVQEPPEEQPDEENLKTPGSRRQASTGSSSAAAAAASGGRRKTSTSTHPAPTSTPSKKPADLDDVGAGPSSVRVVLEAVPAQLRTQLAGHQMKRLSTAIKAQLRHRTATELAARIVRRWATWTPDEVLEPVAVAITLVRPSRCKARDVRCEDGQVLAADGSTKTCTACAEPSRPIAAQRSASAKAPLAATVSSASTPIPAPWTDNRPEGVLDVVEGVRRVREALTTTRT